MATLRARRFRSALALSAAAFAATACSSMPGLQDPEVTISPRYYMYELRGAARMQSVVDGQIVENAPMDRDQFGQGGRGDDVGGVLAVGDGFSGIEFEYQKVELDDPASGILSSDYGDLQTGMSANSEFEMDEFRLTYIAELIDHDFAMDQDNFLRFRFGAGAALVHREGRFDVFDPLDHQTAQGLKFKDQGMPYLSLRGRVGWREVSLQVDWDYNPDVSFGGDFEGHLNDLEILGRYVFEAQDVAILAGYRWSDLQTSGYSGELRYDMDFDLQGYLLGLEFTF